jgi:hypothetical protein
MHGYICNYVLFGAAEGKWFLECGYSQFLFFSFLISVESICSLSND